MLNTIRLVQKHLNKDLFIENRCESLEFVDENNDGVIISPVSDEISTDVFEKIKSASNFVLLDPQGFLRNHDIVNKISLKDTKLSLDGVTAIKVNPEELFALTGSNDDAALMSLQKRGIENVRFDYKGETKGRGKSYGQSNTRHNKSGTNRE